MQNNNFLTKAITATTWKKMEHLCLPYNKTREIRASFITIH